ncbi:MAG: universal stress protein [Dehalococcoidia bacterium]
MNERLLVPLDGSKLAEVALPYAEEIAGKMGCSIILLMVVDSEGQNHELYQSYMGAIARTARYNAERHTGTPAGREITISTEILIGNAEEQIVDYAERKHIDMIVMATHGRSGINRWALGSVANKLVRAASCAVVLVRAGNGHSDVRKQGAIRKVLVPLDGSEESETIIPYIEKLGSSGDIESVLLRVVEETRSPTPADSVAIEMPYEPAEKGGEVDEADRYLRAMAGALEEKGVVARYEVKTGDPADEVIKYAVEIGAGLTAMSTHGRSGILRWIMGSVADRVLHYGDTALMLVRMPGAVTE